MKNVLLVISVILMVSMSMGAVELPEFIHVCKRNDPNVDNCIKESVESLKPYLTTGVPEYKIPSLEPLLLKELIATEGTGIRVTARDVFVYGASNFMVTKMQADLDELVFLVEISLPNIYVQGLYEVEGKVLLLPISGSGPMTGNFTSCTGDVRLKTEVKKGADGEDHIEIVDFTMKITVGHGTIQLDNLFGGEKVLGDVINSAINSNFNTFLEELEPIVAKALSDAFFDIGNSIVTQFTYQQLFPES